MNKLGMAMIAMVGVNAIQPSSAHAAIGLYGTFYNETLANGDQSYTFGAVDTISGHVMPQFDFTLSGSGITGLAFDPDTHLFAAVTADGNILNINALTHNITQHAIVGLPVSSYTNFQG